MTIAVHYVEHAGKRHVVLLTPGESVMSGAVKNDVPGIEGRCGGSCACATCHVYVDEAWLELVGVPIGAEVDLLDFVSDRNANSRLACQITVTDELNGLIVRLPASQSV